jgi:hypothetical protein
VAETERSQEENGMDIFGRKTLGYIAAGLVGLVISYFGGREHLKYEMQSALQSTVGEMQKKFSSNFGG